MIEKRIYLAPLSFLVISFYIYLAFKSSGYHQEDEHYQIIEFANYKLGLVSDERLAWEFDSQIRPGLQPLICYILFKFFDVIKIHDGYVLAFWLRAVTAVVSFLVITKFVKAYRHRVAKKLVPCFIILSYFLWFLPYINVRFSSETWSGMSFLLALTVIENRRYDNGIKKLIWIGMLLGTAILFRYQSGLLVAGMIAWFIFIDKLRAKHLSAILLSVLLVLGIGILVDRWLYGEYVLTIYNYFNVNLIQGVSSKFGVSPWYEYLYYILTSPGPFGIFIIISFLVILYYEPKNLMLWSVIPFIAVHSFIPHKELRFLFPIANLVPLFLILGYQKVSRKLPAPSFYTGKFLIAILIILCAVVNIAGLIAILSTGAGTGRTIVAEYIHRNYDERNVHIIVVGDINPYMDWGPPKNSFYSSAGLSVEWVSSIWQDDFLMHKKPGLVNLLVIADDNITGPRGIQLLDNAGFTRVYQNIPNLVKYIYDIYDPALNDSALNVYEFR